MKLELFSYVGDGADDRVITFNDCTPDFVFMAGDGTNGICRSGTMPDGMSKPVNGTTGMISGGIKSFGTNQMVIGTHDHVNTAAKNYWGVAVEDNCGGDFAIVEYEGDSTDNRTIQLVGCTNPAWVIICPLEEIRCTYRTNVSVAEESFGFTSSGLLLDHIQELGEDFIVVGSALDVNSEFLGSPAHYHLIAMAEVAGLFATVGYTGDGIDNRDFTGLGFQPGFGFIHSRSNLARFVQIKHEDVHGTGDVTTVLDPGAGTASNKIQAFEPDGFEIGTQSNVNTNGEPYQSIWFISGGGTTDDTCEEEEVECPTAQPSVRVPDCRSLPSASHPVAVCR